MNCDILSINEKQTILSFSEDANDPQKGKRVTIPLLFGNLRCFALKAGAGSGIIVLEKMITAGR